MGGKVGRAEADLRSCGDLSPVKQIENTYKHGRGREAGSVFESRQFSFWLWPGAVCSELVPVIAKDRLAPVSSIEEMVDRTCKFHANSPGHERANRIAAPLPSASRFCRDSKTDPLILRKSPPCVNS